MRELRNTVARLLVFPHLGEEAIDRWLVARRRRQRRAGALVKLPLREAREAVVRAVRAQYLAAKLREHGGNVSRAAGPWASRASSCTAC